MKKAFLILLILPCLVLSLTHTVKLDGTGDFTSIQQAINVCAAGDTTLVYPGRYFENLNFNGRHGINLFSLEAITNDSTYIDNTIIDGNQNGTCVEIFAEEQNLKIQGFSITNGNGYENSVGDTFGGGIMMSGDVELELVNCKIFSNSAYKGGGIMVSSDNAEASFLGVQFYNNYASQIGGGIYISRAPSITFSPTDLCSIYGNYAAYGCDVFVDDFSNQLQVELNLDMFTVMQPTGYYAYYQGGGSIFGYTSPNMSFNINRSYLTEIDADLYVSPSGSDANDGLSPSTPFKTIKKALYMVKPDSLQPNTIHLAAGVYTDADEQIFPLAVKSHTRLVGAGKERTKIYNNSGAVIAISIARNARNILLEDFSVTNPQGGSIGGACISHIVLKSISTKESASGLSIGYSGKITFENIDVIDNTDDVYFAGARIVCDTLIIKNSKFMNNTSQGNPGMGGHNNFEADVTDSLYIGNSIFMNALNHSESGTNALLVRDRDHSINPTFIIENCLIAANISTDTNAVANVVTNGKAIINNCTFANNSTGGGFSFNLGIKGSPATISNSIFYNNTSPYQIKCWGSDATNLTLYNNIIQGGQAQINPNGSVVNYDDSNLDIDPIFAGGNQTLPGYYKLHHTSPAINAGTQNLPYTFAQFDLALMPRIYQHQIDIGCYEWQGSTATNNINQLANTKLTAFNSPNPFNPSTKICFNNPQKGKVSVEIYNVKGQKVKTLANNHFNSGVHNLYWQGKNNQNQAVASGVYFYKVKTNTKSITKKMLLMK